MRRRLLMVVLALGAVAGFGSAAAHGLRSPSWGGHCAHHADAPDGGAAAE